MPVSFMLDQVINFAGTLSVPKGAREPEAAMRLLDFMSSPEQRAEFCNLFNPPMRWSALPQSPTR